MFERRKNSSPKRSLLIPGANPSEVPIQPVLPKTAPVAMGDTSNAEETIRQLERMVSDFATRYASHTQRIPTMRPGEHPLIAFVRTMAASMASKQEQLEKLNQDVIAAAKEKERFFASVSHEVRTPMNGIFGMVNLLLEMDLDPVHREHLEAIHSASESLLNILDDILDYAKLNARELNLKPRRFELQKLIREVLMIYKPNADARRIGLSATICDKLPEAFVADDLRLKQVLANLTNNAIKFTDEGYVTVTVQAHRKADRDQLLFRVSDSGIGIPDEAGATLFTPFRQIDSQPSRTQVTGTGLGLAISKSLVEMMGGQIWFESQINVGTTFFFTVDYTPAEEKTDDLIQLKSFPAVTDEVQKSERHRVLLAEDNLVNQKVASLSLQRLNCDVTIASNGKEAVDLADGPLCFDLILMDVNMPVMNGLEATCAIRRLDHPNASAPIIAMTGMVFEEDRQRCFDSGMNDIITKPFSLDILRQHLSALEGREEKEPEGVELLA